MAVLSSAKKSHNFVSFERVKMSLQKLDPFVVLPNEILLKIWDFLDKGSQLHLAIASPSVASRQLLEADLRRWSRTAIVGGEENPGDKRLFRMNVQILFSWKEKVFEAALSCFKAFCSRDGEFVFFLARDDREADDFADYVQRRAIPWLALIRSDGNMSRQTVGQLRQTRAVNLIVTTTAEGHLPRPVQAVLLSPRPKDFYDVLHYGPYQINTVWPVVSSISEDYSQVQAIIDRHNRHGCPDEEVLAEKAVVSLYYL